MKRQSKSSTVSRIPPRFSLTVVLSALHWENTNEQYVELVSYFVGGNEVLIYDNRLSAINALSD